MKGSPWTFNNQLLVFADLTNGIDPLEIQLLKARFWVQVHNLLGGMYSETMAKQFGNFIGDFIDYDAKAIAVGLRNYMCIRVLVDI